MFGGDAMDGRFLQPIKVDVVILALAAWIVAVAPQLVVAQRVTPNQIVAPPTSDIPPAPPALSTPLPVELAEADAEALVVGDRYRIRVKRRGISHLVSGDLVKVNNQWIVLRMVSEGRTEFAVPVVSKVPYFGKRLFKNVGIGRIDETLWIPREVATVDQRTITATAPDDKVTQTSTFDAQTQQDRKAPPIDPRLIPSGEEPPTGSACDLELASSKEVVHASGDVVAVTDEVVSLMITENLQEQIRVPVLGDVPFLGKAFSQTRTIQRQTRRHFDRADLMCVRINNLPAPVATVELTPVEPAAEAVTKLSPAMSAPPVARDD